MVLLTIHVGLGPTYYYLSKIPLRAGKDRLGSVRATIDELGNRVGYDYYYPFGGIMPGRSSNSAIADAKYKFTGKERDVETGLDYFGARYYDSWRGQWLSVDPHTSSYPALSPYVYVGDNPIAYFDLAGTDSLQAQQLNQELRQAHNRFQGATNPVCNLCAVGAIKGYAKTQGFAVPSELVDKNGNALHANTIASNLKLSVNFALVPLNQVGGYTGMGGLVVAVYANPEGSGHIDVVGSGSKYNKTYGNYDMTSIGDSPAPYGLGGDWQERGNLGWSFGSSHPPTFYLYTGFTPRGVSPYEPTYGPYYVNGPTVEATNLSAPAPVLPPTEVDMP